MMLNAKIVVGGRATGIRYEYGYGRDSYPQTFMGTSID
jgi:hypothetical protein